MECWECRRVPAGLACSRCKLAAYCSAECQRAAWRGHKPLCEAQVAAKVDWVARQAALSEVQNCALALEPIPGVDPKDCLRIDAGEARVSRRLIACEVQEDAALVICFGADRITGWHATLENAANGSRARDMPSVRRTVSSIGHISRVVIFPGASLADGSLSLRREALVNHQRPEWVREGLRALVQDVVDLGQVEITAAVPRGTSAVAELGGRVGVVGAGDSEPVRV
mmetsp:Transcript_23824/g.52490  ORF Transcript_23824/g.52490 Transcript_23824/m.52490 type:complete len:227 (+) Transcript_23824:21-701(+)